MAGFESSFLLYSFFVVVQKFRNGLDHKKNVSGI